MAPTFPGSFMAPVSQVSRFSMGTAKALHDAQAMERSANKRNVRLIPQMSRDFDYVIYLYNILQGYRFFPVVQPPIFPSFQIPFCPKGDKFSFAILPAVIRNP